MTSDKKGPHDPSLTTRHPSLLLVGTVRRPHGLAGEVSVEVATDFPDRFRPGTRLSWRRREEARELEIAAVRPHGGRLLMTFEGLSGVDNARALAGGELFVGLSGAAPTPAGFYYSHEVEGFRAEDVQGRRLGTVRELAQTAAGPMLTLETSDQKEALVPFVEEMVLKVDREGRRIVLELPEGLLDL